MVYFLEYYTLVSIVCGTKGLLFFFFFFFLKFFFFYHSSLLTQFSPLVTHNLKYPNFLYPPIWHIFLLSHHSNISTVLWDPCLTPHSQPP